MNIPRLVIASMIAFLVFPSPASARDSDLNTWVDRELIPYVNQQLLEHPRFKGETIMFVVMDDNAPSPVSNELALSLRDRLLHSAIETEGVRIAWRQGKSTQRGQLPIDCTLDEVHYYIGLELSPRIDQGYAVNVRALDLEDRNWVSGFGDSWSGGLDRAQLRALQSPSVDETFQGARDVPFTTAQADLLAQHLARELSCSLLRQSDGVYVVPAANDSESADELAGAIELIGNNIAAHAAIELTPDETSANAVLSGKAHQIDGALYQYWLTVTPRQDGAGLTTLSASAYVLMPDTLLAGDANAPAARPVERRPSAVVTAPGPDVRRASVSIPNAGSNAIIDPLSVASPKSTAACDNTDRFVHTATYWSRDRQCSLLRTSTHADSIVFLIEHQPQLGLVRLGDSDCRKRTAARVARRGEALQFPIAYARADLSEASQTHNWLVTPTTDTYYAVAVADARAARRIANHMDHLPIRCGSSSRPGLRGRAAEAWLNEFAMLAADAAEHIDWRAIEIRDVL